MYVTVDQLPKDEKDLLDRAVARAKQNCSFRGATRCGAALLAGSGKIYEGSNIERMRVCNSTCAERSVLDQAIQAGETSIQKVFLFGYSTTDEEKFKDYISPCGLCRQMYVEFYHNHKKAHNGNQIVFILANNKLDKLFRVELRELMPFLYDSF